MPLANDEAGIKTNRHPIKLGQHTGDEWNWMNEIRKVSKVDDLQQPRQEGSLELGLFCLHGRQGESRFVWLFLWICLLAKQVILSEYRVFLISEEDVLCNRIIPGGIPFQSWTWWRLPKVLVQAKSIWYCHRPGNGFIYRLPLGISKCLFSACQALFF